MADARQAASSAAGHGVSDTLWVLLHRQPPPTSRCRQRYPTPTGPGTRTGSHAGAQSSPGASSLRAQFPTLLPRNKGFPVILQQRTQAKLLQPNPAPSLAPTPRHPPHHEAQNPHAHTAVPTSGSAPERRGRPRSPWLPPKANCRPIRPPTPLPSSPPGRGPMSNGFYPPPSPTRCPPQTPT